MTDSSKHANEIDILNDCFADALSDIPSENECAYSDDESEETCEEHFRNSQITWSTKLHSILNVELESDNSSDEDVVIVFENVNSEDIFSENWTSNDVPPKLEAFKGHPGLTVQHSDEISISEAASVIFGEEFFEMLCEGTNLYHLQTSERCQIPRKLPKWVDVSLKEMKKFLGIILLMGQMQKYNLKDYWSTDPLLQTPIFAKLMSWNRFEEIMKFWHFNDNEKMHEGSGRLYKIKPLLDYLLQKFRTVYKPKQQLSMKEGMIPWRGKLSSMTYNSTKLINSGILVSKVCESDTGYVCNMELFIGEEKKLSDPIQSVVGPYLGVWHHIYQNNYQNGVASAEMLLQYKTRVCGKVGSNAAIPKSIKELDNELKRGEIAFQRKGDVIVLVWKDKQLVHMISTIHDSKMGLSMGTKRSHGKAKPVCFLEYNEYMKFVDRADQYLPYYHIMRRCVKWTKKVAMYLINCGLFNSYIIYRSLSQRKVKYEEFLYSVAKEWIADQENEVSEFVWKSGHTATKRAPYRDSPQRLSGNMRHHLLEKIISSGSKKYPSRVCRVCATSGKRSETRYICKSCKVPVHKGDCFQRYHTLEDYSTL